MASIEDIEKTIEDVEKSIDYRKQIIADLKASEEIELVYLFGQKKVEITEELYEVILNHYEEILKDGEEWLERLKEEKRLEEEQEEEITDGNTDNTLQLNQTIEC